VLTVKAFAVDATAARRAATENFIAALYDDRLDEWERGRTLLGLPLGVFIGRAFGTGCLSVRLEISRKIVEGC